MARSHARSSTAPRHSCATDVRQAPLHELDWTERRVTVMGLGWHGGGVAAARFLAQRGARVTISDRADPEALAASMAALVDVPIAAWHLGGHQAADFDTDFVVVNPAVPPTHPFLEIARAAGARLISETELFLAHCPARVIGVTGSNGKSTTCAMLAGVLAAAGMHAWLGGNIGVSLLGDVERMAPTDWVVLELSSFQLAHLSAECRLPEIAIVTNCTANHLDWHGTWEAYAAAKRRIINRSGRQSAVVLNPADSEVSSWASLAGNSLVESWPAASIPPLFVPGVHNRDNAACAAAVADVVGVNRAAIEQALCDFRGLPHRMELVAELAGRRFYNDSKSTTPAATIAALWALDGPTWLLAGGRSKGCNFSELGAAVVARCRGAALFGEARDALHRAIVATGAGRETTCCRSLPEAFDECWRRSCPGDNVLFSPACASHDQFRDYQQRGETFRALVAALGQDSAARPRMPDHALASTSALR